MTMATAPVSAGWPEARAALRQALLDAVTAVRPTLAADGDAAEAARTLPTASVEALRDAGLFGLKAPRALGGAEADPVTQIDVIEALSYIEPAAGWCAFIGAGALSLTAYLPDAAVARMWGAGRMPTLAGLVMPGQARRVEGGYQVNGRWSWASGVRHADWVAVHVLVPATASHEAPASRMVFLPASAVTLHDNWHVSGLKGTGSCDFTIEDQFVAETFSFDLRALRPQRGGPLYRIGLPGLIANELGAFAVGVARRAIDEMIAQSRARARGYAGKALVSGRAVFQHRLGEADFRLRAARALLVESYERVWTDVCGGQTPDAIRQVELRGVVAFVIAEALSVVRNVFSYGGGSAVRLDNMLQRCLRDLEVGSVHLIATDAIYEQHGRVLLGETTPNPMV